ncbi:MAG: lipoprotein insertase outer membrane protein LolB [Gammaproteobacteria bacterium]
MTCRHAAVPAVARYVLALATALLLGACAHRQPAELPAWSAEDMAQITRFDIKGKVGFRRGETGGSAALLWQQENDRYRLTATGPLGAGSVRIDGTSARVRIEDGNGSRESGDPEALLAEAIGWPVSINSLSYWVRGLPAPQAEGEAAAEIVRDAAGRPVRLRQQEWEVVYDRWQADGSRLLPHKVVATGGDSRVTLLIERWTTPPPVAAHTVRTPATATPAAAP